LCRIAVRSQLKALIGGESYLAFSFFLERESGQLSRRFAAGAVIPGGPELSGDPVHGALALLRMWEGRLGGGRPMEW